MKTDKNVENILKLERRKVFHVMNGIPWILLFVIMSGIALYFYRQSIHAQNVYLNPLPREMVVLTNVNPVVSNTNFPSAEQTNVYEEAFKKAYSDAYEKAYSDSYNKSFFDFQVDAVSNNRGEWLFNVQGERSFQWKKTVITNMVVNVTTNVIMDSDSRAKYTHGMLMPADRNYPFTVSNWELSKEINLNIEQEIIKIITSTIQAHFISRRTIADQDFKNNLQMDILRQIQTFFDGFETLNREKARRR